MWEEEAVAFFKVLLKHLTVRSEENYKRSIIRTAGWPSARNQTGSLPNKSHRHTSLKGMFLFCLLTYQMNFHGMYLAFS
jgi:hypothetical protein